MPISKLSFDPPVDYIPRNILTERENQHRVSLHQLYIRRIHFCMPDLPQHTQATTPIRVCRSMIGGEVCCKLPGGVGDASKSCPGSKFTCLLVGMVSNGMHSGEILSPLGDEF